MSTPGERHCCDCRSACFDDKLHRHNRTSPFSLPSPPITLFYSSSAMLAARRPRASRPSPLSISTHGRGASQGFFSGFGGSSGGRPSWGASATMDADSERVPATPRPFGGARPSFGSGSDSDAERWPRFWQTVKRSGASATTSASQSPPMTWRQKLELQTAGATTTAGGSFFTTPPNSGTFFTRAKWETPTEIRERQHRERMAVWAPSSVPPPSQPRGSWNAASASPAAHSQHMIAAGRSGLPEEPAWFGCVGEGVVQIQEFLVQCKMLSVAAAQHDGVGCFGDHTRRALAQVRAESHASSCIHSCADMPVMITQYASILSCTFSCQLIYYERCV